jgi:hypothetical protein
VTAPQNSFTLEAVGVERLETEEVFRLVEEEQVVAFDFIAAASMRRRSRRGGLG